VQFLFLGGLDSITSRARPSLSLRRQGFAGQEL
jgi:hypothetical protein